MSKIVVVGSLNEDHVYRLTHFPSPGETLKCLDFQTHYGGKGANQAIAAARCGADVALIGCVGNDRFAKEILKELARENIDTTGIQVLNNIGSGAALVLINNEGENAIVTYAGSNGGLDPASVQRHAELIGGADYVLLQNEIPLECTREAIAIAVKKGTRVLWNPAPAQGITLDDLGDLSKIDLFTPNQSETELLFDIPVRDSHGARAAAQKMHQKGLQTVVITLGAAGVWLSENGQGELIAGFPVDPVDTTGAGDTFNGALLAELVAGRTLREAIVFGQAAAALAVTQEGAQSAIPTNKDVRAFLAARLKETS